MINIRPDGTPRHKSETCGVETRDLAAALADRLSEAARAHPSVKYARLIMLVGATSSCDRSDPVAAFPGAIDVAAGEPAIPDILAVCDVGTGPALDIIERALPLGSVPVVTDVLRVVLADGSIVEKSRFSDVGLHQAGASAAYSTADDATRGRDSNARRVRTYWFPPAHHYRADVIVRSSNNTDAFDDKTGGAARSFGGPEAAYVYANRPRPVSAAVASGFVIVSSTCCRHGDNRNEPPPCVGPPLALERFQRISVGVSGGASLVLEFSEGGAVTVYVDAERGASKSSVRRALLPLVDHFRVPQVEVQRPGSGNEKRCRGVWSPSPSTSASAASASVRPGRPRGARGGQSGRAYTTKELPPPPE